MPSQPSAVDRPLPIFSWAMYDFANTIYSAIVVTAFFPLFMKRLAGRDLYTGLAQTLSMVVAGILVPVAGAWADRTGKAKRYLWWLTLACCIATFCIGLAADDKPYAAETATAPAHIIVSALLLFGLANLSYQAALAFYNSLLPTVASPKRQGKVSGLGVGLGYVGVFVALPLALWLTRHTGSMRGTFLLAGALFLVSSIPTFLFVRPDLPTHNVPLNFALVRQQFRQLGGTLKEIWGYPAVLFFFIGNFLCVDVVNTLIMWTRPYLIHGSGFSEDASGNVLMGMTATAVLFSFVMGWLTDRIGPKRTMLTAAGSMIACLTIAGSVSFRPVLLPAILVFGSAGLAGTWVAGRKFLLEVAPPDKVGEFFGLYGVTVKLSVFGCTLFSALADTAGYRVALLSLLGPMVVGTVFLALARPQRIDSSRQEGTP